MQISMRSMVAGAVLMGCGGAQTTAETPVQFSYTEPQAEKVDVTLGIVRPSGAGTTEMLMKDNDGCFAKFASSFKQTLYDMMIAKGMNTTGPFDDIDEMTFPQKKQADLVIAPRFDFSYDAKQVDASSGWSTVTYKYHVSIGGSVSLDVLEPLSKEKMWTKKIDLAPAEDDIEIDTAGGNEGISGINSGLTRQCQRTLKAFYDEAMPKISKYFSSEELALLKKQSNELREKKVY